MRSALRFVLALVMSATVSACSESTSTGDPLPADDAPILAEVLFDAMADAFVGGSGAPAYAPAAGTNTPIPFNQSISESGSCDGGGTVSVSGSVSGTIDDQTFEGSFQYDLTERLNDCRVTRESREWVLNGDPNIRMQGSFDITQTSISATLSMDGGFRWATEAFSGSCRVELNISMTGTQTTQSGSMTGSVCGHSISVAVN